MRDMVQKSYVRVTGHGDTKAGKCRPERGKRAMTAIISGSDLGLLNNPLAPAGRPNLGQSGQSDQVYVNSATGNLVIQARDEYLAASGADLALIRTYNSL